MPFYETVQPSPQGWLWEHETRVHGAIRDVTSSLRQMHRNIVRAVEGLPEESVWIRIAPDVSAIGNLLMHMKGSTHQWIVHRIGQRPLERDRDQEFAQRGGIALVSLLSCLDSAMSESFAVLEKLSVRTVSDFRAEDGCSIPFILHYTSHHLAVHLGQIIAVRESLEPGFRMYH